MQLKMVVFASPVAGHEAEFFAWYDRTHMKDMLQLKGIESFDRYDLLPEPGRSSPPGPSLAIFTWEVKDVATAREILARAQQEGMIPLEDSMDKARTRSWFFAATDGSEESSGQRV